MALGLRDAAALSVRAYVGLWFGEALGLRWGDVRERTVPDSALDLVGTMPGSR
jgi:hypothetical protein